MIAFPIDTVKRFLYKNRKHQEGRILDTHKEARRSTGKWAIITLHPSLPSRTEQVARARAWGLDEELLEDMDVSAIIEDDVRKETRTTNWQARLFERSKFIDRMKIMEPAGGTVFFASPLCVGFGEAHARQTVESLWGVGFAVYVHTLGAIYKTGDDLTEFLAVVTREANAAYARKWRGRKGEPAPTKRRRKP